MKCMTGASIYINIINNTEIIDLNLKTGSFGAWKESNDFSFDSRCFFVPRGDLSLLRYNSYTVK